MGSEKDINLYMVGGAVRDLIRGVQSKDIDFAVEADSFDHMREWLLRNNFVIFAETPKYFTLRAKAPKGEFNFANMNLASNTFDFTLCRTERDYTDGRHPDVVEMGSIYDDLSRRDFTMNAIALDKNAQYINPHEGIQDIQDKLIRCVGSVDRLKEDPLRILRAIRFYVQLGFELDYREHEFIDSYEAAHLIDKTVSLDRIREELHKAFKIDTWATVDLLWQFDYLNQMLFTRESAKVWLKPTTEQK